MAMKHIASVLSLAGVACVCTLVPQPLQAQACQDEESMVVEYKKGLVELIDATRKETLPDFEKAYHQKAGVTKLGLTASMVDGLVECLDKATQDPAAKDQADALKAKRESYGKLKEKLEADRKSLKEARDPKAAKSVLAKLEYVN